MSTVLSDLCDYLHARDTARDGEARPCAILWTDPRREWTPAIDRLQQALPELLVLGDYDPSRRTGPAVWLRCVVDGKIAGIHTGSGGAVSEAGGLSVSVTAHTWDGDALGAECRWGPGWRCEVLP